jgi:hypothetical protein
MVCFVMQVLINFYNLPDDPQFNSHVLVVLYCITMSTHISHNFNIFKIQNFTACPNQNISSIDMAPPNSAQLVMNMCRYPHTT